MCKCAGSAKLVASEGNQQKSAIIGISAPGKTIGYPINHRIYTVIPSKAMADIRQTTLGTKPVQERRFAVQVYV